MGALWQGFRRRNATWRMRHRRRKRRRRRRRGREAGERPSRNRRSSPRGGAYLWNRPPFGRPSRPRRPPRSRNPSRRPTKPPPRLLLECGPGGPARPRPERRRPPRVPKPPRGTAKRYPLTIPVIKNQPPFHTSLNNHQEVKNGEGVDALPPTMPRLPLRRLNYRSKPPKSDRRRRRCPPQEDASQKRSLGREQSAQQPLSAKKTETITIPEVKTQPIIPCLHPKEGVGGRKRAPVRRLRTTEPSPTEGSRNEKKIIKTLPISRTFLTQSLRFQRAVSEPPARRSPARAVPRPWKRSPRTHRRRKALPRSRRGEGEDGAGAEKITRITIPVLKTRPNQPTKRPRRRPMRIMF